MHTWILTTHDCSYCSNDLWRTATWPDTTCLFKECLPVVRIRPAAWLRLCIKWQYPLLVTPVQLMKLDFWSKRVLHSGWFCMTSTPTIFQGDVVHWLFIHKHVHLHSIYVLWCALCTCSCCVCSEPSTCTQCIAGYYPHTIHFHCWYNNAVDRMSNCFQRYMVSLERSGATYTFMTFQCMSGINS